MAAARFPPGVVLALCHGQTLGAELSCELVDDALNFFNRRSTASCVVLPRGVRLDGSSPPPPPPREGTRSSARREVLRGRVVLRQLLEARLGGGRRRRVQLAKTPPVVDGPWCPVQPQAPLSRGGGIGVHRDARLLVPSRRRTSAEVAIEITEVHDSTARAR